MVQEKQRGAWIYFMEGMWYVPLLFIVIYHIYIEVQKSRQLNQRIKRMYLKSIPFLVFFCMMIAILFRIATGIVSWFLDTKAPHLNNIVCFLYGWSVQFFAMEFFFIILLLMKLAVVFMDKNVHFGRIVIVDRIIIGNVIMSLLFYITIAIIVLVDAKYSADIDKSWRLYFICSAALITGSLGYFGIKILKLVHHNPHRTKADEMLISKVKGLIGVTSFLGIVLWVINIVYITIGRDSNAEDWINIGFFALELINCYATLIIFGRSTTCIKIRVLLGYPESMVGSDSSKQSSGSSGGEVALAITHISTHYTDPKDDLELTTTSQNVDITISSNSSVSN